MTTRIKVTAYRDRNEGYPSIAVGSEDELITHLAEEQGETEDNIRREYMFEPDSIDIPTDTIHVIAGQSDGYISTYYSKDKALLDWWYDADCEYFGGTDSDHSFECIGFPEYNLTDVNEVMDNIHQEHVQRDAIKFLEANHPGLVAKWAKEWSIECSTTS
ncbi:hypothetical protein VPHD69_0315 [Vibrio phage D69]